MLVRLQCKDRIYDVTVAESALVGELKTWLRILAGDQMDTHEIRFCLGDLPLDEHRPLSDYAIGDGAILAVESTINRFNYKSFSARTFEDLDTQIQTWLRLVNKRLLTISYGFDGTYHRALLATNPVEVRIVGAGGTAAAVTSSGSLCVHNY